MTIKKLIGLLLFLLISGIINGFATESTASVINIAPHPDRKDAVQIFLDEDGDFLWEKRLDLFGEYVQQILKNNIAVNGRVIYANEGLQTFNFTSFRLLIIELPNGDQINVLDLFPHFNDRTLKYCFPYAFAKRQHEQKNK